LFPARRAALQKSIPVWPGYSNQLFSPRNLNEMCLPVAPRTNICSGMVAVWILGEGSKGGLTKKIYKFQGTMFIKL
jgi:hypothetical protein